MLDALNYSGGPDLAGKARNLLHQAAAAVLNAANPNLSFGMSVSDVVSAVNTALASGDTDKMGTLQDKLDKLNDPCPF